MAINWAALDGAERQLPQRVVELLRTLERLDAPRELVEALRDQAREIRRRPGGE